MRRLILGTVLILVLVCGIASADTHYVSPYGADIYPYTTWINAADSIQKAIDVASYGDTVRVGAGTYKELIEMIPGIALIGAGMDSCMIDGRRSVPVYYTMIEGADSSTIEGFHLLGGYPDYTDCIGIASDSLYGWSLKRIANNKISNFSEGVGLSGRVNTEISNNIFVDNYSGIRSLFSARGVIVNNTFTGNHQAVSMWVSAGPTIIKNIISHNISLSAISGDFTDSIFIENNLIYDIQGDEAIFLGSGCGVFKQAPIRNNTIVLRDALHTVVAVSGFGNEIRNNVISQGHYGIRSIQHDGCNSNPQVSFNDLWNNAENYYAEGGASIDTSLGGNIYSDPMFVGGDDYHLQYGSPCIDAGDPNVKDPDSSRSDIGCYGGTWGETYTYQDYPPKAPDSLTANSLNTVVLLSWKPNTESDLSHYLVYRDTIQAFIPDTFKIVANIPKDSSVFWDYDFVMGESYYYQVSAWDLTAHESEYSDELEVEATSVGEYTEEENRPPMYRLFQNYPNPFNSSTVIWYYLPDVGYQPAEVEITIYNILGKPVRRLVSKKQYPGTHKVLWDGKDDLGNEEASGIYFCRLKVSGLELSKPRKMVLLK